MTKPAKKKNEPDRVVEKGKTVHGVVSEAEPVEGTQFEKDGVNKRGFPPLKGRGGN